MERVTNEETARDPFADVDKVSNQIFDRVVAIADPDQLTETQTETAKSRLQKVGEFILETAHKFGDSGEAPSKAERPDFDWAVVVEGEEPDEFLGLSGSRADAEAAKDPQVAREEAEAERVSYKAARKRSNLPDGIELLQGKSSDVSTDATMAAIKLVMIEQKREQTRASLPELEPEADAEATVDTMELQEPLDAFDTALEMPAPQVDSPQRTKPRENRLVAFFRQETVLAISLSIWAALALMITIDPALTTALMITSMYLLFVSVVLFAPRARMAKAVRLGARNTHAA